MMQNHPENYEYIEAPSNSPIWQDFWIVVHINTTNRVFSITNENIYFVRCKNCMKVLRFGNHLGTANLKNHLAYHGKK